jgi:integrase
MERAKRPYSIQKRSTSKKNRSLYYVQFRNPETTKYMTAVSSGQTSKSNAQNWADEQIKSGKVIVSDKKNIFFESFAKEFWDWNTSPYVKGKLARGMQIGQTHVKTSAGYIARHVIPAFKGRMLGSITPADVETWILALKKKGDLKAKSINLIYMAFRTILKEAFRLGYIPSDPTIRIQSLAEEKSMRGVLSIAELKKLFADGACATIWKGDHKLFVANLLAACTGMREGEIRGLLIRDVHEDYIDVQHSWEQGYGLKGAKWGSERRVTVPKSVSKLLAELITNSPYKAAEDLVFYGKKRDIPIHARAFIDALYASLGAIGIDEEERKARAVTFHSWRHFLNSISRGRVPDEKLRLMTGHRTEEMTEHYTHLLEEDYTEIRKVQEDVFGNSERIEEHDKLG